MPHLSRKSSQRCDDCPDKASCHLRPAYPEMFWWELRSLESRTLADLAVRRDPLAALPA